MGLSTPRDRLLAELERILNQALIALGIAGSITIDYHRHIEPGNLVGNHTSFTLVTAENAIGVRCITDKEEERAATGECETKADKDKNKMTNNSKATDKSDQDERESSDNQSVNSGGNKYTPGGASSKSGPDTGATNQGQQVQCQAGRSTTRQEAGNIQIAVWICEHYPAQFVNFPLETFDYGIRYVDGVPILNYTGRLRKYNSGVIELIPDRLLNASVFSKVLKDVTREHPGPAQFEMPYVTGQQNTCMNLSPTFCELMFSQMDGEEMRQTHQARQSTHDLSSRCYCITTHMNDVTGTRRVVIANAEFCEIRKLLGGALVFKEIKKLTDAKKINLLTR